MGPPLHSTGTAARGFTRKTGPERALARLSCGNLDPEQAVVEWECLLAGAADRCGRVVFATSPRQSTALAKAERPRLRDVAASRVQLRADDGETVGAEIAEAIVGDLAALTDSARHQSAHGRTSARRSRSWARRPHRAERPQGA
ncbi:hypothetical protein [Streptomyces erythrochromogenes]|uniref:hypothetical protein n=1 Tax=Streptomyces erythrochromogenes TaxID=285574 RepID=UPI0036D137BA